VYPPPPHNAPRPPPRPRPSVKQKLKEIKDHLKGNVGSAHGHYAYRIGELAEELKVDTFPRWFGEGAVVYTQDDANEIWFRYKSFLHSKVCTRPLACHRAPQLRCHCPAPSASPRCGPPPPLARPVLALGAFDARAPARTVSPWWLFLRQSSAARPQRHQEVPPGQASEEFGARARPPARPPENRS
jgi:hypothetical protein